MHRALAAIWIGAVACTTRQASRTPAAESCASCWTATDVEAGLADGLRRATYSPRLMATFFVPSESSANALAQAAGRIEKTQVTVFAPSTDSIVPSGITSFVFEHGWSWHAAHFDLRTGESRRDSCLGSPSMGDRA